MNTMIGQQYAETLQAISFLQDRLYNARDSDEESPQERLVREAYALIQQAHELAEGRPAIPKK